MKVSYWSGKRWIGRDVGSPNTLLLNLMTHKTDEDSEKKNLLISSFAIYTEWDTCRSQNSVYGSFDYNCVRGTWWYPETKIFAYQSGCTKKYMKHSNISRLSWKKVETLKHKLVTWSRHWQLYIDLNLTTINQTKIAIYTNQRAKGNLRQNMSISVYVFWKKS